MGPTRTPLGDGRWHLVHGPIELVIGAEGPAALLQRAHDAAWTRFQQVLQELVDELPWLRRPVTPGPCPLRGPVARRMWHACAALPSDHITPMAAVAGAVAQEILAPYASAGLPRAYVNNGGDIALHLAPGTTWRVGAVADIARAHPSSRAQDAAFVVRAEDPVRGVATSGWRGRSHSLGIADAVTVLAAGAAQADAAATLVANAVNADHPGITRAAATTLRHDSDLGERLVTVEVSTLPHTLVHQALQAGLALARTLQRHGLICGALLACQGQTLTLQPAPPPHGVLSMAA